MTLFECMLLAGIPARSPSKCFEILLLSKGYRNGIVVTPANRQHKMYYNCYYYYYYYYY